MRTAIGPRAGGMPVNAAPIKHPEANIFQQLIHNKDAPYQQTAPVKSATIS